MSTPKFDEALVGDIAVLLCPRCGGNNLHQERVDIWEREKEDDPVGLHVQTDGVAHMQVDGFLGDSPSGRRNGLRITFSCEQCQFDVPGERDLLLFIWQHKGTTFVDFKPEEDNKEE